MAEQLLNTIMIATISSLVFLTTAWTDQQQRQQHLFEEGIQGWLDRMKCCHIPDDSLNIPMKHPAHKITVFFCCNTSLFQ